jgi:hypothetical protein
MKFLGWVRDLLRRRINDHSVVEIVLDSPTECRMERLNDQIDVIIESLGSIIDTEDRVHVKIILSEPDAIRQLSALMLSAVHGLDASGPDASAK